LTFSESRSIAGSFSNPWSIILLIVRGEVMESHPTISLMRLSDSKDPPIAVIFTRECECKVGMRPKIHEDELIKSKLDTKIRQAKITGCRNGAIVTQFRSPSFSKKTRA
jgi:hypothetical protein